MLLTLTHIYICIYVLLYLCHIFSFYVMIMPICKKVQARMRTYWAVIAHPPHNTLLRLFNSVRMVITCCQAEKNKEYIIIITSFIFSQEIQKPNITLFLIWTLLRASFQIEIAMISSSMTNVTSLHSSA